VDGIAGEHVAEARRLSQLAVGISNALVNLGMLHIWDIPLFLKSAQEVLTVAGLLLECLREAWASGAGPPVASCYSSRLLLLFLLFFAFGAVVIYIYKDIGNFVPLHPCVLASPTTTSWGTRAHFRQATPLQQEASTMDRHDCILPEEGHRVAPARVFVEFHTSGKGP
jgi:hypothetical protein